MIICHDWSSSTQSFHVISSLFVWPFGISIPCWKSSYAKTHPNPQLYHHLNPCLMTNSSCCPVLMISRLRHHLVLPLWILRAHHPYLISHGDYLWQLIAMLCDKVASPHSTGQLSLSGLTLGFLQNASILVQPLPHSTVIAQERIPVF